MKEDEEVQVYKMEDGIFTAVEHETNIT